MKNQKALNEALYTACEEGNLSQVRQLLTGDKGDKDSLVADIHAYDGSCLRCACKYGHLEIVQYLLASPDLKEHADIHAYDDKALIWACNMGHLGVVKYLLASPDLKMHADIHAQSDYVLRFACKHGDVPMARYLLTSTDLSENANPHVHMSSPLRDAHEGKHMDIVQILLYDVKMEVSQGVYEHIKDEECRQDLMNLVARRDLFFKIQSDLEKGDDTMQFNPMKAKI